MADTTLDLFSCCGGSNVPFRFFNASGMVIPAYAVMQFAGIVVVGPDSYVSCKQFEKFGSQYDAILNGGCDVPIGAIGVAQRCYPALGLYQVAEGTPAYGADYGPHDGYWELRKSTGGFVSLGNVTAGYAAFNCAPWLMFYGQPVADINKGNHGMVRIYMGTLGSETATGFTMDCWSLLADADKDQKVRCFFRNGGFEIDVGEC